MNSVASPADLAERFRRQAVHCRQAGSPLTATLLAGAADELGTGSPVDRLLGPLAHDRVGSVPALRFAGALHRLVLERRAPALALHYPSVGGAPGQHVWTVARDTVEEHQASLAELVRRPVQTNEVGRAGALLGGLLHLVDEHPLPIALLEFGASGGLNLHPDRFRHEVAPDLVLGDPASPVVLDAPWQGPLPPQARRLEIASRAGCDPAPLDPGNTADRLTLTSYVWADQIARFERLRGALEVSTAHPTTVENSKASAFLTRELATPRPGRTTVVWHSVVHQYLSADERTAVVGLLDQASARATTATPLAHLRLEPVRVGDAGFRFEVTLTTWPGGRTRVLADCEGHGPPIIWR